MVSQTADRMERIMVLPGSPCTMQLSSINDWDYVGVHEKVMSSTKTTHNILTGGNTELQELLTRI